MDEIIRYNATQNVHTDKDRNLISELQAVC